MALDLYSATRVFATNFFMLHLQAVRWQRRLMSVRSHHHKTTASDLKALISEVSARYELGCDWIHQIANRGSLAAKVREFTIGVVQ